MNDQAKISMNSAQRGALKKAITAHESWKTYRERAGLKIEIMSVGQLLDAAYDLNITPDVYMSAAEAISPPPINSDAGAQLAAIIGQIAGQSMSPDAIHALVDARVNEALKAHTKTIRFECKGPDGNVRAVEGHKHPVFADLLLAATSRMRSGFHPNIWLSGPTGTGKSHIARQLSEAMGVPFYFTGAVSQEFQLVGYKDANGKYHTRPLREAFERPSVFCWDEVDRSDNQPLLAANMPLSNGHADFPDKWDVPRHPDTVFIATGNTWGLGATNDFVGAAKIDAAFLSRFPVKLHMDYDTDLEIAISGDEAFARRVIKARERARKAEIKVVIDTRMAQAGAALIAAGASSDKAAEMTYLANLTVEQRNIVEGR